MPLKSDADAKEPTPDTDRVTVFHHSGVNPVFMLQQWGLERAFLRERTSPCANSAGHVSIRQNFLRI